MESISIVASTVAAMFFSEAIKEVGKGFGKGTAHVRHNYMTFEEGVVE
jgi:hypothetical protein